MRFFYVVLLRQMCRAVYRNDFCSAMSCSRVVHWCSSFDGVMNTEQRTKLVVRHVF